MLSFEAALELALAHSHLVTPVALPLDSCDGLVLADPFRALLNSPRFDYSAVDGYAVCLPFGQKYEVTAENRTGEFSRKSVTPGEAVRVFTGAPVPAACDAVIMQEDTMVDRSSISVSKTVLQSLKPEQHIRRAGEEYQEGDVLLEAGTRLTPPHLSLLASNGLQSALVRRPCVSVLVSGNELIPPGNVLAEGHIFESNGIMISTSLRRCGCEVLSVDFVQDEPSATEYAIGRALDESHLVITTGGVSVGDYDLVRRCSQSLGLEEIFWRVSIRPGKPVFFARKGKRLLLGLPGNPVSAMVTFALFARPLLARMSGEDYKQGVLRARCSDSVSAHSGRDEFYRATVTTKGIENWVSPASRQGSSMLSGFVPGSHLIRVPAGQDIADGDEVDVYPLGL